MFLPPAVTSGDPLLWAIYIVGASLALAFAKLIMTLGRIACLELWARFTDRHRNASNQVQKLIERSSHDDLRSHRLSLPWHRPADTPK